MALHTFVKISSVNNLSDARYCAGMQVNLMGFNLEEGNKNYISPEKFKEITDWLSGVTFVGEFEFSHPENILEVLKSYPGIEFIQIKEEAHLKILLNSGYGIILKKEANDITQISDLSSKAEGYKQFEITLLLHADLEELSGEMISGIQDLASKCQVLLGFGLRPNTILDIIENTGVKGIAMEGGDEIKPGLKDFDELAEILEALEIED
jgi:phosphoribosylanthranilate isomerase